MGVHEREAEFHDQLAGTLDPAQMPPKGPDKFERMLFASLGDVAGKRVLELGCGDGGITLQLLQRGARVTAVDISPGMVEVARARVERFFPEQEADFRVAAVESTGLPDSSMDLVTGKWILHHVDVRAVAEEIRRVLRPGGVGIFFENQSLNPLLALARKHVAGRFGVRRFGTEDEHPLTRADYELWRSMFSQLELQYPDFHVFELVTRQLFLYRYRWLNRLTIGLDSIIWRWLPPMRQYSFHVIVRMTR